MLVFSEIRTVKNQNIPPINIQMQQQYKYVYYYTSYTFRSKLSWVSLCAMVTWPVSLCTEKKEGAGYFPTTLYIKEPWKQII